MFYSIHVVGLKPALASQACLCYQRILTLLTRFYALHSQDINFAAGIVWDF
ncbi:hypothetical protein [Helicobacter sp. 11S02596-1]|uniref:hypothetical protein n=1 Tax=Helicobacter sp. 11S02596-1 TaxID=1476194 RepID=UPI0015DF775C|nr:hypothetical protein [Helicobacter sp. 11S02596-1]